MQLNTNFMQLCATLDIDVKRGQLMANSLVTWGLIMGYNNLKQLYLFQHE